jgi:DNA-binding transcriptional regulator YiaG
MSSLNKCPNCGGEMRRNTYKRTTQVGRYRVVDGCSVALQCARCGEVDLTMDERSGYERRAAKTVLFERPAVEGEVIRFARKALGMRQVDLATALEVAPETISRWETNKETVGRTVQLAIAQLLDAVERYGEEILEIIVHPDGPNSSDELHVRRAS